MAHSIDDSSPRIILVPSNKKLVEPNQKCKRLKIPPASSLIALRIRIGQGSTGKRKIGSYA